jgi:hypothetical protein
MDGLFFLLSVISVGLVVFWFIRNDRVPPGGPTSGLLAMRDERSGKADKSFRPSARRFGHGRRHETGHES